MNEEQNKTADLVVENQLLNNQVMILSQLALGAAKVLDYYSQNNFPSPIFSLESGDELKPPFSSEHKYKVVEVNATGPDKEFLVGAEMYDVRFDTDTALRAKEQILSKLKELGISLLIEKEEVEEVEEDTNEKIDE